MRIFLCLVFLFLCLPSDAHAHPHEWIDVRSKVVFSGGKITAIEERWTFDPYYTALSLEDFDANHNKTFEPDELMALAKGNLGNLAEFSYFTYVERDGKKVLLTGTRDVKTYLAQGRIVLDFTVIVDRPLDPRHEKISYRIYDPSYYISMRHEDAADAVSMTGGATDCTHTLVAPTPDAAWALLAKSLDKNATAPDNLGQYFAERVTLRCK